VIWQVALLGLTAALVARSVTRVRRRERAVAAVREDNVAAGLVEPPTLHPEIDAGRCIGCGGCVTACPEKTVLGLVGGIAELVEPTSCIGHGACKDACPSGAIRLVFGTATRGIDLPVVHPDFQTDVPGLFIAGELGGMGLIRNAVEQGRQAVESIRRLPGIGTGPDLDLIVVGAGPAGLSAALAAHAHRLRHVVIEQDTLGGTIAHYPRGKVVMTAPARLPVVGRMPFREASKEDLVRFWETVARRVDLPLRSGERVDDIRREGDRLAVVTDAGEYRARAVLLAIGRRGTPRKLGVPGEDLSKVIYRLADADEHRGRRALVVGGGDSALEAAAALAEAGARSVTLAYRGEAFSRARAKNRERAERLAAARKLRVALRSRVIAIEPGRVVLECDGVRGALANDLVVVCAGGVLPSEFLRRIGVPVETRHGSA